MIRAVIFDLDGTLLDTLADIAKAANEVLTSLGQPTHSEAAFRFLVGEGVAKLFQRAWPACQEDALLLQRCMDAFRERYSLCWDQSSQPYSGIRELLDWLNRAGIPIAVLSNKPDEFTRKCVDRYFSEVRFDAIRGQTAGVPPKPDPTGVQAMLKQMNVSGRETVYVGDTRTDMLTAHSVGCFAAGVTWGFRPESELLASGAQRIFHQASELHTWIADSAANELSL